MKANERTNKGIEILYKICLKLYKISLDVLFQTQKHPLRNMIALVVVLWTRYDALSSSYYDYDDDDDDDYYY